MTHLNTARRVRRATVAVALTVLGVGTAGVAQAAPPTGLASSCSAQRAAMDSLKAEVVAHNGKPHLFELPREQAGFDAYNAEKRDIDGRVQVAGDKLDNCITAALRLAGGPFALVAAPVPAALTQLVKSGRFTAANRQGDVDELLDTLDEAAQKYDDAWKDAQLQGATQPNVGTPDPARPGQSVGPDGQGGPQVTPDWIVPLSDILKMPKFMQLDAESMWMVTMSPLNREWVSNQGAMGRRSPSVATMAGVSEQWLKRQKQLTDTVSGQLEALIGQLADSQPDDQ
jgi:hypothetical protein